MRGMSAFGVLLAGGIDSNEGGLGVTSSRPKEETVRTSKRTWLRLAMLVTVACNDSLAPFQPEIANQPDNFQLQATNVRAVTNTFEYTWQNSGTTANVNQATIVAVGTAQLTILDSQGTQVYSRDLSENGTFQTTAGTTGAWKIRMALTNYSGTLNFRAQKP